jgi:hypothetical protein
MDLKPDFLTAFRPHGKRRGQLPPGLISDAFLEDSGFQIKLARVVRSVKRVKLVEKWDV